MKTNQTICQFLNIKVEFGKPFEIKHNGNVIYIEDSSGFWCKREFDSKGNPIYYEDSDSYWVKYEFDSQGNRIYYENSKGYVEDKRVKELTLDEIAEKFNIPVSQLKIKK